MRRDLKEILAFKASLGCPEHRAFQGYQDSLDCPEHQERTEARVPLVLKGDKEFKAFLEIRAHKGSQDRREFKA